MNLLAIETSCDETAAARHRRDRRRRPGRGRSARTSSPRRRRSIASGAASCRSWRRASTCATSAASSSARSSRRRVGWTDLGAVAVTQGPGLVGSLLVGVAFAKALAWSRGIPLVPVHHLAGHIESLVLAHGELPLPAAVLVVSGGHTSLYLIREPGALPADRPDAGRCGGRGVRQGGEAARARLSGRPGRSIGWRATGNDRAYDFPTRAADARRSQRAAADAPTGLLPPDVARRVDFSFSGLKTAVLRLVRERTGIDQRGRAGDRRRAPAPRCRRRRSPTSAPASSASSSRRCSIGRSRRRAGSARAASASRAACRRTAGCAPTPKRAARRLGHAGLRPAAVAVDRQRRDDRRRRAAPVRSAGPATGLQRGGVAGLLRQRQLPVSSCRRLISLRIGHY